MPEWFETWFDEDYARLYAHRDAAEARRAVAMALEAAPILASGPVLDLACGAGRHLEVLRQTNPQAFGLDLSRELLALAPLPLRPWLLRADMRRLPLRDGHLAGVCLWFTPFGYFDDGQNRALLFRLADLLAPGGILVLDYLNAGQVRRDLVPEDTVERGGVRIRSRRGLEGDRLVKHMELTRLDTGESREALESMRLYEPREILDMAQAAGLECLREAGDYGGAPFQPESSPRWIAFFRRSGGPHSA